MKTRRCALTWILAAGAWHAAGQTIVDLSRQGKLSGGTALPVHCTVGQVFFKTDAPAGTNLYACTAANVWTPMGVPALGGDASGTQQSMTVKGIQGRNVSGAGPADQNVLQWSAANGQWQPGQIPATGAAAPPATCPAGSLYLRSDSVNNIQQLYVCANTNTWAMVSIASGPAAGRPANCVAGQTWLSTDSGAMTYCSATGNPGTWSATLAGPQGPAGPQGTAGTNGNTIWNGSTAPSGNLGANGDFYLNTATSCLYGPKAAGSWPGTCTALTGGGGPNFSATSGTSTTTETAGALGQTNTFVDPNATNDSWRSNIVANNTTVFTSGLNQPGNYANVRASNLFFEDFNGNNSPDNTDKKTKLASNEYIMFRGSGQKLGHSINVTCPAAGDCGGVDIEVQNGGHPTAYGDEAGIGLSVRNWQPDQVQGTLTTPPVTTSACNTTTTGSIAKSQGAVSPVTVGVVSTSGCSAGDLVTFDQGAFGVSDFNKEVVKITAVTGGGAPTITALFQYNHAGPASVSAGTNAANAVLTTNVLGLYPGLTVALSGESTAGWNGTYTIVNWPTVTDYGTYAGTVAISLNSSSLGAFSGTATLTPTVKVQPAPYVAVDNMDFGTSYPDTGGYGQDRLAILNPGSPVTTAGHITSTCNDQNQAQCTFAGDSSTDWTSHGIGNQGFCIRPDIDQYSFQGGSTRSYYWPINGVTDAHHLTVYHYNGQAISGTYTYQIVTCGQIAYHDLTATSSALTVRGIALYYNPNAWTSGSTFLQPMNQWSTVVHNVLSMGEYSGPQGYHPTARVQQLGSLFRAFNNGGSTFQNAFFADKGYNGASNTGWPDYQTAFNSVGVTQYGAFSATGKDLSGIAVAMQPYSGDPKCLRWNASAGYENSQVCAGLSGTGAAVQADSEKINLGMPGNPASGILDYSSLGLSGSATWKLPAYSGGIAVDNPGAIGVTTDATAGNAITLGSFQSTSSRADYDIWVTSTGSDLSKRYTFASSYRSARSSDTWMTLIPLNDFDANPQTGTANYAIDVLEAVSGAVTFRIRTVVAGAVSANVYLKQVTGIPQTWTPCASACDNAVTTPTAMQPTTVLRQHDNKVDVVNAGGFAATIDPTSLTAARTITLPNAGGTPLLYQGNTTGSTAFAPGGSNCPAANCATPYTWMQVTTADGSTGYIPVFK